ncbi:MAG: hypothetical protein E3J54_05375 [Actinobacteria bacterium]|nr:MAG: hypothetical protein E3J54_05375 [Actinomycetota bacterium]
MIRFTGLRKTGKVVAAVIIIIGYLLISSTAVAAPQTTISLDPSRPETVDGWYRTIPTITLTASEPATIYYQWDSTTGSWQTYSAPFASLIGTHTLYFYSLSTSAEEIKAYRVKVDPTITPPATISFSACEVCHGPGSTLVGGDHVTNYLGTFHDTELRVVTGEDYPDQDRCRRCHTYQMDLNKEKSLRSQVRDPEGDDHAVTGNDNSLCFACHDVARSNTPEYNGDTIFNQVKHSSTNSSGRALTRYPDADFDSGMCGNCHNPHGVADTTNYLRVSGQALCSVCHDDPLLLPKPSTYAYQGTTKYSESQHASAAQFPEKQVGECANCHNPHGVDDGTGNPIPKMTAMAEENLCYGGGGGQCHSSAANSELGVNIYERFNLLASNTAKHNVDDTTQVNSEIECAGCHNPHLNNRSYKTIDPDAKATLFSPPPFTIGAGDNRFEETELSVAYTGNWYTATGSGLSGGSRKYSWRTGATATITFNGTEVTWISFAGRYQGIAEVYVDNVFQQDVDLYQPINIAQAAVYTKTGLASGSHTLRVRVKRTKNPLSRGYYVSVDAFDVKDPAFATVDYTVFCNKCHDNTPPAGVSIPPGMVNISTAYFTDFHGSGDGSVSWNDYTDSDESPTVKTKSPLKAPYSRAMDAVPCQLCHDQHGSANVFHFNENVNDNSVTVTSENGADADSLCSSCHPGTVDDFHAECLSCHNNWGHVGPAPTTFAGKNCFDCHKHGRTIWTPYPDSESCEMYFCHPMYKTF